MLLYGENGSGKSSLYQALNLFFTPNTQFNDNKNIFATTDDGFVKLEIRDSTAAPNTYEWDATSHPSTIPLIAEASKTKGFLDYRLLLETHFVHRHENSVNIFELLMNNLLANIQDPVSSRTFGDEWNGIQPMVTERKSKSNTEYINERLTEINTGLITMLSELTAKSNEILGLFEQNVTIELTLDRNGLQFVPDLKSITGQIIELTADYYGKKVVHHHFLNEARLSAIAISIYLAALQLNPRSKVRILFLDDVLIGLDMSNRLPLLDILDKYFADWQIILATYDRVWFDMASGHVMTSGTWQNGELYCGKTAECDIPLYKGNIEYLAVAKQHLINSDLKAAAIYIRSAYELALKRFCDKHKLSIRYCEKAKDQNADDFWTEITKRKLKTGPDVISESLIKDVDLFRSKVLHQLSHTAPINLVRAEVEQALKTIKVLQQALQSIRKGDLQ